MLEVLYDPYYNDSSSIAHCASFYVSSITA